MEKLLSRIKELGLKITVPRRQILNVLNESNKPLTISEIVNKCGGADFTTVFRTVKLFSSKGLLQSTNFNDKQLRYSLIKKDNHPHHILCKNCGKIEELEICIIDKVRKLTDYRIVDHSMEFIGICPECKK
ncbi:MAG: transcriptional repressor [Ignavibacteriae bacterium]|nr:transcriptional repressor [Ignavibacteriota bacterium]NOG99664.1 transcriptional repressor [Ignavibacteriota bacterium]